MSSLRGHAEIRTRAAGRARVDFTPSDARRGSSQYADAVIPERFAPMVRELKPLADRFHAAGHRLFVVGGAVRDLFDGRGDIAAARVGGSRPRQDG